MWGTIKEAADVRPDSMGRITPDARLSLTQRAYEYIKARDEPDLGSDGYEPTGSHGSLIGDDDLSGSSNKEVSGEEEGDSLEGGHSTTVVRQGFTCLVKEYGVTVKEDDPLLVNAGPNERWERRFGMYGVEIVN